MGRSHRLLCLRLDCHGGRLRLPFYLTHRGVRSGGQGVYLLRQVFTRALPARLILRVDQLLGRRRLLRLHINLDFFFRLMQLHHTVCLNKV